MPDLENIKEGDFVALMHGSWSRDVSKRQVTRTTPTRIYIGEAAYTRRGYLVGTSSSYFHGREYISAWNEEHHSKLLAATRLRYTQDELSNFPWRNVDQATADAVLAIIKPKGGA